MQEDHRSSDSNDEAPEQLSAAQPHAPAHAPAQDPAPAKAERQSQQRPGSQGLDQGAQAEAQRHSQRGLSSQDPQQARSSSSGWELVPSSSSSSAGAALQGRGPTQELVGSVGTGSRLFMDGSAAELGLETTVSRNRKRRRTEELCSVQEESIISVKLKSDNHAAQLMKQLKSLYDDDSLCDITVRVEEKDFKAHRLVLAASSDVLRALLVGGWRESKEEVITLDGVDARSFELILTFLYSGELVAKGVGELLDLLVACEHLAVATIRDLCVQRLQQRLDLPNALQMRVIAQQIGCMELEAAASEVVWGQFSQVVAGSLGFLELEVEQLGELLGSDKLVVDNEEEVYGALLTWVRYCPGERSELLPRLFRHVRLAQLPLSVLEGMKQEELLKDAFPEIGTLIEQAIKLKEMSEDKQLEFCESMNLRPRTQRIGRALYALGGRPAWTRVERFDVKTCQWDEVSPMAQKRMRHGSATLGGLIYVVGGKDELGQALSSMERYDPHKDVWQTMAPLKLARTGLGVGVAAGKLYAVGGRHDSGYRLKTVESYDVQTNTWSTCALMTTARGAVRVGSVNGCLYAVGGRSDSGIAIGSVEMYEPMEDTWRSVASMLTARVGAGVDVLDGYLYAVGGKDERGNKLRSVERYDYRRNEWFSVADMKTKRWGAGVVSLDHKLYVIGGMNGAERGTLPSVEVYDPATDSWSELDSGPQLPRGSCTFCAA